MTEPMPDALRRQAPAEPEAAPTGEAAAPEPRVRAVLGRAAAGAADVVDTVAAAREALHDLIEPVVERTRRTADAAVQQWRNREATRIRRLRRRNKEPLPNVFDLYPEARNAARRQLGLLSIPVEEIRGTAVEGPDQRGRDFLPPPVFRSENWKARWQRVRQAVAQLATLPPIEVLKAGGGYWVLDGHNRVAAALYTGQLDIDAVVTSLRLPGDATDEPTGSLAPLLADAEEMRAVRQQWSRTPVSSADAEVAEESETEISPVPGGEAGGLHGAPTSPERPVPDR